MVAPILVDYKADSTGIRAGAFCRNLWVHSLPCHQELLVCGLDVLGSASALFKPQLSDVHPTCLPTSDAPW